MHNIKEGELEQFENNWKEKEKDFKFSEKFDDFFNSNKQKAIN